MNDVPAEAKPLHDLVEERRENLAARRAGRHVEEWATIVRMWPWLVVGLASAAGFALAAVIGGGMQTLGRRGA